MDRNPSQFAKPMNRPLIIVGVVISITVIIFTVVMITNTDTLARYVDNLYTDVKDTGMGLIAVRNGVQDAYFAITGAMGDPSVTTGDEMKNTLDRIWETTISSAKSAEGSALPIDADLKTFLSSWNNLKNECYILLDMLKNSDLEGADKMFLERIKPVFSRMDRQISRIINDETERISQYVVEATSLNDRTNKIAMALGIGVVILILGISIWGTLNIARKNREIFHKEQLFRMITENVDDVYVIYDKAANDYEFISRNIGRLFGTKDENQLQKYDLEALYKDMAPETLEEFRELYYKNAFDEITEKEYEMKDPVTGEKCTIKTLIYPIIGDSKRTEKIICIVSNITKAKRAKEVLEEALKVAEDANNAKRLFMSRMSHEIKTPINAIKGMRGIAEDSIDDKQKVLYCLNNIGLASTHLLGLVEDVLDVSKLENGSLKILEDWFDIDEMIESAQALLSVASEEKGVNFTLVKRNITNNTVYGDPLRVRQILVNFLSNAIKFTPKGGNVTLSAEQYKIRDGVVPTRFSVIDTGIGIRPEFMDKIFVPFEQDDTDLAASASGSGLGMSISKNLANLMGGEISVKSELGNGSEFIIDFNFKIPAENDLKIIENESKPFTPPNLSGKRILLVEDNEINMEIMLEIFGQTGCAIEKACNGQEAVNMYLTSPPGWYDIIMMDIQMPIMEGDEAAAVIRAENRPDSRSVIIIAMTANEIKNGVLQDEKNPIDAQVTKPIDARGMFDIIKEMLKKKHGEKEDE